jgi:transcriptional regulator with XRE-family HTH domain
MALSHVCKTLKETRQCLGITLKNVSQAIGVDVGQLSKIERGMCRYLSPNLKKYCKYLGVPFGEDVQSADLLLSRISILIRTSEQHAALFASLVTALEARTPGDAQNSNKKSLTS